MAHLPIAFEVKPLASASQKQRMACAVERHGGDKRHLVLRAAPGFASGELGPKIGIVELNGALEPMGRVLRSHCPIDLLVQEPGSGVAHARMTLQGERGITGLGLADEIR